MTRYAEMSLHTKPMVVAACSSEYLLMPNSVEEFLPNSVLVRMVTWEMVIALNSNPGVSLIF